jgi:hypothetical protein
MKKFVSKYLFPAPRVEIHNVIVQPGGYIRLSLEPVEKLPETPLIPLELGTGWVECEPVKRKKCKTKATSSTTKSRSKR